jgi:hypothetical protein
MVFVLMVGRLDSQQIKVLTLPVSCEVRSRCSFPAEIFKDNSNIRHVQMDFWPGFCSSSGVFCIGEVFDADIRFVEQPYFSSTFYHWS